ncbi:MAG: hypothetical protein QNJ51_24755 [Calothrix sp. MO_167.B12]|nr:hypothetical protein [Calothrix sp. MO_167.B12]
MLFFAQVGINEALNSGAIAARSITESWDKQWLDLLQNDASENLYGSLTRLGTFFAVGTLLFFMMQWLKDAIYSELSRPLSSLIWPFIVVVLLANVGNGTTLSNLSLGVRDFLNGINQQVVTIADADLSYQQALNMSVAEEIAGSFLRPCQSLTGELRRQCFDKVTEKTEILWEEYRNLYGDRLWITKLETKVNQIADTPGVVSDTAFNALLGSTFQTTIKNFLISLQYAFQNLIEGTMLLVAALGPLAVGGSLLPVAGKPIFAWITGFLSMGIAKISFNLIVILTARVIIDGPAQDAAADPDFMWFLIFLGILAPILSLMLAAAGGFAVFNGISNTSSWVRERI